MSGGSPPVGPNKGGTYNSLHALQAVVIQVGGTTCVCVCVFVVQLM